MHSGPARVLIVDDDPEILSSMQKALQHLGHTVRVARSAKSGVLLLQTQDADVVITDLLMDDDDGLDFIQELRQSWPRVRIIAISGGGRMPAAPLLNAAVRLGAHAAFQKPISIAVLEATIRRLTLGVPRGAPTPHHHSG